MYGHNEATETPAIEAQEAPAMQAGETEQHQKPPRPTVPKELREWTRKWAEETNGSAEFVDACRQYDEDMRCLFPADALKKESKFFPGRKVGAKRPRKANREVQIGRIFQNSQQSLAVLMPGDINFRVKARPEIPAMGGMTMEAGPSRDPYLLQWGLTCDDRIQRHFEEAEFISKMRDWARHTIWFRAGIFKMAYQRDFHMDPLMAGRMGDAQNDAARMQYLLTRLLRGEIEEGSAESYELQCMAKAIQESGEIAVWAGLVGDNIPLNRFICDGRVRSLSNMHTARWQGDIVSMTGADILTRWPYEPKEDGTWEGVHPDDLMECPDLEPDSNLQQVMARERELWEQRKAGKVAQQTNQDKRAALEDRMFLVKEVWAACESNTVFWLIPGLQYPADKWIPTKRPQRWFPYYQHVLNPQPETWYGRSDTELMAPIQDRRNRKRSDQEIARWLSMGSRGIADVSQIDGQQIDKIRSLSPGDILKMMLNGQGDINKAISWLVVPYNKESFDDTDDAADERLIHRMPEQAMGITDPKTTATAIQTANVGSQIAFTDRQFDFNQAVKRIVSDALEILAQEERPEEVRQDSGPNALWPKIYGDAEAKKLYAQIQEEVKAQVVGEIEGQLFDAEMSGEAPAISQEQVDQRIAHLTEQKCLETFGFPEPLSREGLFRRSQVQVKVDINGAMDRERRVMSITKLLHEMIGLGIQVNPEPIGRLLSNLMGEDDTFGALFKPDPNQLVAMLAQIAEVDPSKLTPEAATVLANLGLLAQQLLAQQPAEGAEGGKEGGQGGGPAPAPAEEVPAGGGGAPTSSGQASANARGGTPTPAAVP
jgi:hypothetical protein